MDSSVVFLFLGLIILLTSGKYLVDSSVVIARLFRIPTIIIGLTIVAFGTSAPELLVSVQAAVQGHPDIAMGNVIGSNISNILLVLAATAVIFPIMVEPPFVRRDWPILAGISLLLTLFILDLELKRWEGLVFLGIFALYIIFSIRQARDPGNADKAEIHKSAVTMKWWTAAIIFLASCAGLSIGADILVESTSEIAGKLGISERVISISMVALGTSLPELTTSVIAALKKETSISVGNIIGSNIMNIISVLGLTAVISPIGTAPATLRMDIPWMLGATLLLFLFMVPARKGKINRFEGVVMIVAYLLYIYFIFTF